MPYPGVYKLPQGLYDQISESANPYQGYQYTTPSYQFGQGLSSVLNPLMQGLMQRRQNQMWQQEMQLKMADYLKAIQETQKLQSGNTPTSQLQNIKDLTPNQQEAMSAQQSAISSGIGHKLVYFNTQTHKHSDTPPDPNDPKFNASDWMQTTQETALGLQNQYNTEQQRILQAQNFEKQKTTAGLIADQYKTARDTYENAHDAYINILQGNKAGDAPGDLTMLANFSKLLNPDNKRISADTVGQLAQSGNLGDVVQRLYNQWLGSGGKFSPEMRGSLINDATNIWNGNVDSYRQVKQAVAAKNQAVGFPSSYMMEYSDPLKDSTNQSPEVLLQRPDIDGNTKAGITTRLIGQPTDPKSISGYRNDLTQSVLKGLTPQNQNPQPSQNISIPQLPPQPAVPQPLAAPVSGNIGG